MPQMIAAGTLEVFLEKYLLPCAQTQRCVIVDPALKAG